MVRTRVGYAGGTTDNPTYYNLGDYTETLQIDYDPARVSYEDLLSVFWDSHNPVGMPWSRQYMSIIFYHDDEQKRLAEETKAGEEFYLQRQLYTEIVPASAFYLAEDYHQKYRLQGVPELFREFSAIYPEIEDFIASTAVARVNGYIGGYGSEDFLEKHIGDLGLSQEGQEKLLEFISGVRGGLECPVPASG